MSDSLLLGIDVGTTGCRACLIESTGDTIAQAAVGHPTSRDGPGRAEQNPEDWWRACCHAIRSIAARHKLDRVRAVAVCGQSTPLLPVARNGRPLRDAVIWQDTRAAPEAAEVEEQFGRDTVRQATGTPAAPFLLWPKILWFMRSQPKLYQRAHAFLSTPGYITLRLSERMTLSRADVMGYPLLLETLEPWSAFCSRYGFDSSLLPAVATPDAAIGNVTEAAATETLLPSDAVVVAGGMDTACAALGAGVVAEGLAFEVTGTSGGIGTASRSPSELLSLGEAHHVVPGLYLNHAPMSAAGTSLEWIVHRLLEDQQEGAFERATELVGALPPGPTGMLFLPYLTGERSPVWDPEARGVLLGFSSRTNRAEVVKAVMEGVAFGLRQNLETMRAGGFRIDCLRSCGGGSQNALWCQIKADVTGVTWMVPPSYRSAAYGAALLAGIASGEMDLADISRRFEHEGYRRYEPRQRLTEAYLPHYERYRDLYPAVKELFRRRANPHR